MESTTLIISALAFGTGFILGWALYLRRKSSEIQDSKVLLEEYVKREHYREAKEELQTRQEEVIHLSAEVSKQATVICNLEDRLSEEREQIENVRKQFTAEFQNLCNRIFDEKSQSMTRANAQRLEAIIGPFDKKIEEFGKRVQDTYVKGTQERSGLKEQLRQLMEANMQLSQDAVKLADALRGDTQFQGSWGEIQLKRLLEKAGLQEGTHFTTQDSARGEEGARYRTDFIIHLPGDKHVILDSKVSMVAFEQYYNSESEEEKQNALDRHLASIKKHIKDLSEKNYIKLHGLNTPDYVLMFMPLEPAFIAAVQADPSLYEKALDKNIAIVSGSTLMATLRMIAYLWKSENQTQNVIAIAREAGALYDKFVGFLKNMSDLGRKMDSAREDYTHAMNKLKNSPHQGTTLIGRMERIRELGADTSKRIPREMITE